MAAMPLASRHRAECRAAGARRSCRDCEATLLRARPQARRGRAVDLRLPGGLVEGATLELGLVIGGAELKGAAGGVLLTGADAVDLETHSFHLFTDADVPSADKKTGTKRPLQAQVGPVAKHPAHTRASCATTRSLFLRSRRLQMLLVSAPRLHFAILDTFGNPVHIAEPPAPASLFGRSAKASFLTLSLFVSPSSRPHFSRWGSGSRKQGDNDDALVVRLSKPSGCVAFPLWYELQGMARSKGWAEMEVVGVVELHERGTREVWRDTVVFPAVGYPLVRSLDVRCTSGAVWKGRPREWARVTVRIPMEGCGPGEAREWWLGGWRVASAWAPLWQSMCASSRPCRSPGDGGATGGHRGQSPPRPAHVAVQ